MAGLAVQVEVRRDTATPAVQSLLSGLRPEQLQNVIGRSAVQSYRTHLFGLNRTRPNALGGQRTNFYAAAARATSYTVQGDFVVVSINQQGMAQRYFGGTIRPRTAKFLTIPVHPSAHGHRAGEFDLEVVFGRNGEPIALATKSSKVNIIRQTATGRVTRRLGGRMGEIYFRLVKSVNQQPDPTVLPYPEQVQADVLRAAATYAQLLIDRAQGGRN